MNKSLKKFLACLLTSALVLGAVPVQADAAAAKPKLNVSSKTLTVGSKTTLKVKNKVKGSKYTWSAGNKKVASVTKKGVVKAVNPGNTTITCKVKAPKKTYTLKCKIKVTGAVTAATQKALDKALKNPKVTKITLKTTAAKKFTIQAGNYGKKTLAVDAPNADVTNNGVFKSITIKNIKPSTWTEKAKGNKLKVTAAKAGIVIDKNASVSKLTFVKTDGEAKVEINGQVENVTVLKKANINITVNGEVEKVSVEAPAAVAVGGTAEKVPVTITEKAAGASIEASVPVIAKVKANVSISLKKGAEGTTIDKTGKTVKVTVENKTAQAVLVTTDGKNGERVESGRQTIIGGETNTDNTTTPDNGNSGGGSSNSGSKPSKPDVKVTSVSVESATQIKVTMKELEGLTFAVTGNDYKGTVTAAYAEGAYILTLTNALENGKEYTLTISKTGYTSYTAAISWNETGSKPDLKVDGVLVESATQVKVTMEELEGLTFTVTGNAYAGVVTAAYAEGAYILTLSEALENGKEYTLTISREGYTSYTASISWNITEEEINAALAAVNDATSAENMKKALEDNYKKLGLAMAEGSDYAKLFNANKNVVIDAVLSGKNSGYTTVNDLATVFNNAVTTQTGLINTAVAGIGEGNDVIVYQTLNDAIKVAEEANQDVSINILNPVTGRVEIEAADNDTNHKITIQDAKEIQTENEASIFVKRPNVVLKGLKTSVAASSGAITNPNEDESAIAIGASSVTVTGCAITVEGAEQIGIIINRTTTDLSDIVIDGNSINADSGSYGIYIPMGTSGEIKNNTISGGKYPIGMEFQLGNNSPSSLDDLTIPKIQKNSFSNNSGSSGIANIGILDGNNLGSNFGTASGGWNNLKAALQALVVSLKNQANDAVSKNIIINKWENTNGLSIKGSEKYDVSSDTVSSFYKTAGGEWDATE